MRLLIAGLKVRVLPLEPFSFSLVFLGRLISPWAGTSPKTANLQWNLQWIGVGQKVLRIIEPAVHTLAHAA